MVHEQKKGAKKRRRREGDERRQSHEPGIFQIFAREAGKVPLLTREKEKEISIRIQNGDCAALNDLAEPNLMLVVKIAKEIAIKYSPNHMYLLDLVNEGASGLLTAAKKFNPDMGKRFITYAAWWIRHEIFRGIANYDRTVRVPVYVHERISRLRKRCGTKTAKDCDSYSQDTKEKADEMRQLEGIMNRGYRAPELSLDHECDSPDSGTPYFIRDNKTEGPPEFVERMRMIEDVDAALKTLPPKQEYVLRERFGISGDGSNAYPKTLREIGEKTGWSREGIRITEKKALQSLKRSLKNYDDRM